MRSMGVAVLTLVLSGCGASSDATESGEAVGGDIVVFAAASLTEAFEEIGAGFEQTYPAATVTFNYGSSASLAQQIGSGAPADVFASAAPAPMQDLVDNGDAVGEQSIFARNRLQIAVPPGNPRNVTGLADLAVDDLTIALCDAQVPCGSAAVKVFEAASITAAPDTLERNVKAALSKVELGEVDAALVYRTDVLAAADTVTGIDFAESTDVVNDYPLSVLGGAPNVVGAEAFVDYVLSDDGQKVLTDAGFIN